MISVLISIYKYVLVYLVSDAVESAENPDTVLFSNPSVARTFSHFGTRNFSFAAGELVFLSSSFGFSSRFFRCSFSLVISLPGWTFCFLVCFSFPSFAFFLFFKSFEMEFSAVCWAKRVGFMLKLVCSPDLGCGYTDDKEVPNTITMRNFYM